MSLLCQEIFWYLGYNSLRDQVLLPLVPGHQGKGWLTILFIPRAKVINQIFMGFFNSHMGGGEVCKPTTTSPSEVITEKSSKSFTECWIYFSIKSLRRNCLKRNNVWSRRCVLINSSHIWKLGNNFFMLISLEIIPFCLKSFHFYILTVFRVP